MPAAGTCADSLVLLTAVIQQQASPQPTAIGSKIWTLLAAGPASSLVLVWGTRGLERSSGAVIIAGYVTFALVLALR